MTNNQTKIAKAFDVVSEHGVSELIHRLRISVLYRVLGRIYRANGGRHESPATAQVVDLDQLTIDSPSVRDGVHYAPTPGPVIDWLHGLFPFDLGNWTFLDLGCGFGRVVANAARRPWGRVIGVDFAEECCEQARANIAAEPADRLRAGEVEIRHGDATAIDLPAGPMVVYLFNPFGAPILRAFLAHLERALAERDRPVIIAYFNPVRQDVLAEFPRLARVRLPAMQRARFALLSPYPLRLYANDAGQAFLRPSRAAQDAGGVEARA